jgi:hypothetical protein
LLGLSRTTKTKQQKKEQKIKVLAITLRGEKRLFVWKQKSNKNKKAFSLSDAFLLFFIFLHKETKENKLFFFPEFSYMKLKIEM